MISLVTTASSAWVRHKVRPHPLCLLKAAPGVKIWLLQLSQVFCWFWAKNLSHYNWTALIPQQLLAFSLLESERLKSSSLRQKILYSKTLLQKIMTHVEYVFGWQPTQSTFGFLGVWKCWCSFGVVAVGEDEAMDSCIAGIPSQYGFWRHSHEPMDFQYIRQNIHVWAILKAIVKIFTAATSRI